MDKWNGRTPKIAELSHQQHIPVGSGYSLQEKSERTKAEGCQIQVQKTIGADGQTPREKYFSYVDKLHESDHEQWERILALLQEIEKDNQEGYDKLVISISSGAVGVSFLGFIVHDQRRATDPGY